MKRAAYPLYKLKYNLVSTLTSSQSLHDLLREVWRIIISHYKRAKYLSSINDIIIFFWNRDQTRQTGIANKGSGMAAAALTEFQGHQEYEECLDRMEGKLGVQVKYPQDYFPHQLLL